MRAMLAVTFAGALVLPLVQPLKQSSFQSSVQLGSQVPARDAANPVLVSVVAPTYPRSRFKNPSRIVVVGLTVNVAGVPESVHVVRSGGERFDKDAVATVTQYRFKPAVEAGVPVARDVEVEVSYKAVQPIMRQLPGH